MPSIVAIEDLIKRYHLGEEVITALYGVSLQVERGQFVAIMGASGSGKTTLLHLTGGLDLPDSGRVLLDGNSLTEMSDQQRTLFRRRHLGIVFQSFNLLPTLTARENVMLPLLVDGRPAAEIARRADELIATVRLDQRARHRPAALSGGEQQRVAIARALINNPVLILADEPTGNLDPASSLEIWRLLRDLADRTKTTILMVTHEAAAAAYADRVHVLQEGRFVGVIETNGSGDAALVATRYAELGH
ncbi:MAG TPA: ABC transporter ATP-binding protein [Phycisphaerae bacterium]|nr:ABC transporter ATP-binding protein [Phycisphaerae bacterium]